MKVRIHQTNFTSGQLDEAMRARMDTKSYRAGAALLRNCLLFVTGGAGTRWGTDYLATLTAPCILHEFVFSTTQSYVASLSAGRADFYFSPDGAFAASVLGAPWLADQLSAVRVAQAGDTMFVVHGGWQPRRILRAGSTTFTLSNYEFEPTDAAKPFFRYADPAISLSVVVGTAGAGRAMVASAPFFNAGHVGKLLKIRDRSSGTPVTVYALVTGVTDTLNATVTLRTALAAATQHLVWEEEAFSDYRGWPLTVSLHSSRLVFGGGAQCPDAMFISKVGSYFNFDTGTGLDDEAIIVAIGADQVRTITHVVSGTRLIIGTDNAIYEVPESEARPLTPGNIRFKKVAQVGMGQAYPGVLDDGILFVQATGRAVRDISYDDTRDQSVAAPVSLAATDVLGNIVDAAYLPAAAERPEQYAFFVNDDGSMAVFHTARSQEIGGWAPWTTEGRFVSVCVVQDQVFAAVERDTAVGTQTFLERFNPDRAFDAAKVILADEPNATWAGLAHLGGLTVHGREGTAYFGAALASVGGEVTLPVKGLTAEIGLAFDWRVKPLPAAIDMSDGTYVTGRPMRLVRSTLELAGAASAAMSGDRLVLRGLGDPVQVAPAPYTGRFTFRHFGWDQLAVVEVERDIPLPVKLLSLAREVAV